MAPGLLGQTVEELAVGVFAVGAVQGGAQCLGGGLGVVALTVDELLDGGGGVGLGKSAGVTDEGRKKRTGSLVHGVGLGHHVAHGTGQCIHVTGHHLRVAVVAGQVGVWAIVQDNLAADCLCGGVCAAAAGTDLVLDGAHDIVNGLNRGKRGPHVDGL